MPTRDNLPRTGFGKLDLSGNRTRPSKVTEIDKDDPILEISRFRDFDEAVGRKRQTVLGLVKIDDPTLQSQGSKLKFFDDQYDTDPQFKELNRAYKVDSYVRQGVNKYVELCTKQGWDLKCKNPEPKAYLKRRFLLMGLMTGKPQSILVDEIVNDFVHYANVFLIKKRGFLKVPVPGIPPVGALGAKAPVLGYFRADPAKMRPVWSKDNAKIIRWMFYPNSGDPIPFEVSDVIHFTHHVPVGGVWGSPDLTPVLEDIRDYRRCEEYVIRLLYKHLNPLIHHEVADNSGYGLGRQEDVDSGAATHGVLAPDGLIVTPPGHKINMIGAESHALRGEGYMKMLRDRVYSGLGVNPNVMGEGDSASAGSADAMTVTMHNRAKFYQRQLGEMLTEWVVYELLLEGGYDPTNPEDHTSWVWNEIETEYLIKKENHIIQKWINGCLPEDKMLHELGYEPMTAKEKKTTYIYRNKLPLIEAQGEVLLKSKEMMAPSGGAKQVTSRNRPSNQHGDRGAPKIRPR